MTLIGVAKTTEATFDDLWIAENSRNQKVGQTLLRHAEIDIANSGHRIGKLHVLTSNVNAIRFYLHHGWQPQGEAPHESLPVTMLQMSKPLLDRE